MSFSPIHFHFEDVHFTLAAKTKIRTWVAAAVENEGFELGPISYIYCSDDYLLKMNIEYLNHDTYTDIITFDYNNNKLISGDLFISYDRIKSNAKKFKCLTKKELHRVMIHGVLHLCGYADKTDEQKQLMRKKEEYYLNYFDNNLDM
jgi:probable rRNA maturation factor